MSTVTPMFNCLNCQGTGKLPEGGYCECLARSSSGVQGGSHAPVQAGEVTPPKKDGTGSATSTQEGDKPVRLSSGSVSENSGAVASSPLQTALPIHVFYGENYVKAMDAAQREAEILKERDALRETNRILGSEWKHTGIARLVREGAALQIKLTSAESELQSAQQTILDLRGAMSAQDERERLAGERCKVLKEHSGCDWPDAVAEKVLEQEQTIRDLTAERDEVLDDAGAMANVILADSQKITEQDLTIQRLQGALQQIGMHSRDGKSVNVAVEALHPISALASDTQQTQERK